MLIETRDAGKLNHAILESDSAARGRVVFLKSYPHLSRCDLSSTKVLDLEADDESHPFVPVRFGRGARIKCSRRPRYLVNQHDIRLWGKV